VIIVYGSVFHADALLWDGQGSFAFEDHWRAISRYADSIHNRNQQPIEEMAHSSESGTMNRSAAREERAACSSGASRANFVCQY
jgi:hypothetical protein